MKNKSIKINAILNGIKQCCTVLFPLITIPYVTRILGNENYGKINFSNSIISYFILIAAFGIAPYAIREGAKLRDDKKLFNEFVNEIFTINIITTMFSYVILFLLIIFWKKLDGYLMLILIQALPIIFTTIGVDWVNNIYEDFLYTTIRYLFVQSLSIILMFILVRKRNDYYMYAAVTAFSSIAANIVSIYYVRSRYTKVKICKSIKKCKKHLKAMMLLFGNSIATTIYVSADITILNLFKGDAITGIYSIAVKIYTIMKQLFVAVIGVTLPRLAYYLGQENENQYNLLLNKILYAIIIFSTPAMVGLFILSKNIILFIAGKEFVSGYVALRILMIALFFALISSFYSYSIIIPNRLEKYSLISTIIGAVVNVLLNILIIPFMSANGAALTTLISEIVVLVLFIYYSKGVYTLDKQFKFMPCFVGCFFVAICSEICIRFIKINIVAIFVAILCSSILYMVVMIIMKDSLMTEAYLYLRKKVNAQ